MSRTSWANNVAKRTVVQMFALVKKSDFFIFPPFFLCYSSAANFSVAENCKTFFSVNRIQFFWWFSSQFLHSFHTRHDTQWNWIIIAFLRIFREFSENFHRIFTNFPRFLTQKNVFAVVSMFLFICFEDEKSLMFSRDMTTSFYNVLEDKSKWREKVILYDLVNFLFIEAFEVYFFFPSSKHLATFLSMFVYVRKKCKWEF